MSNFTTLAPVSQGVPGTAPRIYVACTPDSSGTILADGYLNDLGDKVKANDIFYINYADNSTQPPGMNATFGQFLASYSAPNMSLIESPAPSGSLLAANNLADVANVGSSRTNLGLGSAALLSSAAILQAANNLSDVANAATSRTNLGLGSAAVLSSSAVLQTANNLSELTGTAATARTNLGLGTAATAAASSFQLVSSIKCGVTSGSLGGNVFEEFSIAGGITSSSIIVAQIKSEGSNPGVYVVATGAITGNLSVQFNSDPGTGLTMYYVAFPAGAQ